MAPPPDASSSEPSAVQAVGTVPPADGDGTRRRTRLVLAMTSVLTLLVMGGVIALGLRANRTDGGGTYDLRDVYGDPSRRTPWPEEGCAPDRDRPPRLVFELPSSGLDFGSVKQGVVLEEGVVFRNEGKGPLCIRQVDSGCGCIKAHLLDSSKRRFEPGESGTVRVRLDTKGREGLQKKSITLHTNSLDVPRQRFLVRASITRGLVVTPSIIQFERVTAGHPSDAKVRVRSPAEDKDWTVTGIAGSREMDGEPVAYTYDLVEVPDPRWRILDVVVHHPGMQREGPFQDALRVKTSYPDRPEILVRAHLIVVPAVLAKPTRAVLGYVPSMIPARIRVVGGEAAVTFRITGHRFEMPGGEAVPASGTGFEAEYGPDAPRGWWVDVRYDGKSRGPGLIRATLVLETDHPEVPEVRVDCFATVRDEGR